jgi:hypothetical protein
VVRVTNRISVRRQVCVRRIAICLILVSVLVERVAQSQTVPPHGVPVSAPPAKAPNPPFHFEGPPPPPAPEVIARDAAGRTTIRAVRLLTPLRLDGKLDEEIYQSVPSMSDFTQTEPAAGSPATQKTELWLLFDDDRVYFSFRCWESHPEQMVVNEMRRDNASIFQNDHVAVIFDTFYDRRNGVQFAVTPGGGRLDAQITNESQYNADWNPIWEVAVGKFDGGWTVEAAVPFKSLRYRPGRNQIWGFNARRITPGKRREISFLAPIPNALGELGLFHVSLAATLAELEAPLNTRNLELKPYFTSSLSVDHNATAPIPTTLNADVGGDVKYGITKNLTADITFNPDFAQVEADEQQINLTRFNLFFPEKREFFLENQGTFSFGGAAVDSSGDTPILFYSRQIGLNNKGGTVPLHIGGRVTGRVGRFSVGALDIQSGADSLSGLPSTNFSVVRMKRDIWRRSAVGFLYTGRSVGPTVAGRNDVYGLDGSFNFFTNLMMNTYWARASDGGVAGATSYRGQLDYEGDLYGVQAERLAVGEHFNPQVGFVRRNDMRKDFGLFRYSPRPRSIKAVRKFSWMGSFTHIDNTKGQLQNRNVDAEFDVQFQNSDQLSVAYAGRYEFVPTPFTIVPGVTIPVAGYDYGSTRIGLNLGQQRPISGNILAEYGTFYNGHRAALSLSQGRTNFSRQLSVEPSYSLNLVQLTQGSFTTHLAGSRVTYTATPMLFVSALIQYNSGTHTIAQNARLRWEYSPGSELFIVYNEQLNTLTPGFPTVANRALIVKINRLVRF